MENKKREYLAAVGRDYPHNFKAFILYDLLWGLGMPFSGSTLPIAFLVILGSSKTMIGVFTTLPMVISLIQIITSYYFRGHHKKTWLSLSYFFSMVPWMVFNAVFFIYPKACAGFIAAMLFMAVQIIMMAATVGNEGVRFSMLTECTPLNKRGSLYGSRVVIQVVVSLLVWPIAAWMIKQWPEPRNYLASFAVACFFYMIASFSYLLTREHQDPHIDNGGQAQHLSGLAADSIATLKFLLSDRKYRIFLFYAVILYSSVAMSSFIVVFAKEQMNMSGSGIILFTILQMLSGAILSMALGRLADRIGYKIIGYLQCIPLAVGFLMAAFCSGAAAKFWVLYVSFLLCSSIMTVSRMVVNNLAIEMMPRRNIGMLLSLTNALITPFILIVVPLSGWIVDLTGSYTTLFLIGAVTAVLGGVGFLLYVHEPRSITQPGLTPI
jgi:MFS-type transporter involved in bile tolerance (Atg22 family)